MDLFPDGAIVRLRSSVRGKYLHADEDGKGVSLRGRRASMNVAWRVHRVVRNGVPFILLHGAAYGRYLTYTLHFGENGHVSNRVVQRPYGNPGQDDLVWSAARVAAGADEVILRNRPGANRLLRAKGKSRNDVCAYSYLNRNPGTVAHWVVQAIPLSPSAPLLSLPTVEPGRRFLGRFGRRSEPTPEERTIRYVQADAAGNFNAIACGTFDFQGRSVFKLRSILVPRVRQAMDNITVCTRAGHSGRLTPLVIGLPRNQGEMEIIVLTVGSPADQELQYPDVDAP